MGAGDSACDDYGTDEDYDMHYQGYDCYESSHSSSQQDTDGVEDDGPDFINFDDEYVA
jgi:hypothetical protein